jgi:hypothetical protein
VDSGQWVEMKEIIEKMVRQEIQNILAENEASIKEIVKTSLLPELKAAVRDSAYKALEDLVRVDRDTQEPMEKRSQEATTRQHPSPDVPSTQEKAALTNKPVSDLWHRTLDFGPANARYLYCIVEGNEAVNLGKIGIEGNEVYTIPYKELSAVVHNCPAKPYRSEDEEVVKSWLVTHQKVVDAATERFGTVIPVGFDTIIQGNAAADPEENMKNWLSEDYGNLKVKMEKVRDRAEYGVQVFWDPKVMAQKIAEESPEIKKLDEEIKSKPKGLAYMYRQKLGDLLKKEMEKLADRYFSDFYEKIKTHADDLRVEKTKKTEDENTQMLLNLSCLLPEEGTKGIGEELEKIDALEGFSVRYTGPWPPYSFV